MRRIFSAAILLFFAINFSIAADNSRSDTIDILDYNIHLDITDYAGKTIKGYTVVTFKSKLSNISELDLDLLGLQMDSITQDNELLSFTYNDTLIKINLASSLNTGDSSNVTVYYHGNPEGDASGWGGWYWSGDYSYNLGVGFAADPHVYGRVWFPCFDNFVERSTFHFSIITHSDKMALCNGNLISSIDNGNGTITWSWELLTAIPSYLACVAVNKYSPGHGTYISISGDTIPIQYGAVASDTTKMKNSFIHLPDALSVFEASWGSYRWNKVGYSLTTVGAMEHATNIAYPYYIVNGTTAYENIMAHELSHQWFGNLVTCRTAEDMWLNEGWAVFCEKLFYGYVYGEQKYHDEIAANHEQGVHYSHTSLYDGQYFPVSGVPQDYTYGSTVYVKGCDMVHTLRGYMGDSLFFSCVTKYLSDQEFTDQSSEDLRDYLSSCSGIDLQDFFTDWIFNPGWAAFTIDSSGVEADGSNFNVNVIIRQRLNHAPAFYAHVPLEISFYDSAWNVTKQDFVMSGGCETFNLILPFSPVFTGLDLDDKISDAVTADLKTVNTTGSTVFTNGKMTVNVIAIADSALIRIEHIYAAPDPFKNAFANLHISQERFWKVDGIFPEVFDASATISYNGTTASAGFLDNQLITNSEDSLVVLYRSSPKADWIIDSDVEQNFIGLHTDKKGSFNILHLKKGEYALGIFQYDKTDSVPAAAGDSCFLLSIPGISSGFNGAVNIFPNPASNTITVQYEGAAVKLIEIFNLYGVCVYNVETHIGQQDISVKNWSHGIYFVKVFDLKQQIFTTHKIVIN
ncbi:MAG: M1 family aminopeptidase [Chitinophagales bacterium]